MTSSFPSKGFSVYKKSKAIKILSILMLLLTVAAPSMLAADEDKDDKAKKEEPKEAGLKEKVVVTATRTEEDVFRVPQPVSVITAEEIEEETPNTATDLLRNLPGVDVNGVGTSQPRPIIRPACRLPVRISSWKAANTTTLSRFTDGIASRGTSTSCGVCEYIC